MNINQLTAKDVMSASDLIPIWSTQDGDARRVSPTVLAALLSTLLSVGDDKKTQYAAPALNGFTVNIEDSSRSIWLVLTPTGAFAAGTIKLPAVGNAVEKQEVLVNCTQAIAALTVDGNGANVVGEPAALAADAFFRLRFEPVTDTWYRVG